MKTIFIALLTILSIAGSPALARDKTDVVWLANGDRVTGEIKQLEHGILRISTDSMGEVRIEWDNVKRVKSRFTFQFENTDGERIVGMIEDSVDQKNIRLAGYERSASFAHENVIRISQMEDSFWSRVKGSANFGYSFTKASDIAQLNVGVRATHRTAVRAFTVDSNLITTEDQEGVSTQNSSASLTMTRYRKNRWFSSYLLGFESNDELGLKLRSSLGGGIGRFLIQTNLTELSLLGGLVGTAETFSEGDISNPIAIENVTSKENLEGLIGLEYSKYIFDDPTVDLSLRLSVYPSITESGRVRAQFDANIRRELISDLYWDLTFTDSYDSDPVSSGAASTSDYSVTTSLGWSF
jgi:hypothetical protein